MFCVIFLGDESLFHGGDISIQLSKGEWYKTGYINYSMLSKVSL